MGKCYNTIEIAASMGKVWDTINDFHDMSWAPGVITSVQTVGDKNGGEIGAKRILNDAFHETLTAVDPDNYTFSYTIDDGPGPVAKDAVSNYIGVVKLSESNDGCLVEWTTTYDSSNEQEVADFCNPIYTALLAGLKDTLS